MNVGAHRGDRGPAHRAARAWAWITVPAARPALWFAGLVFVLYAVLSSALAAVNGVDHLDVHARQWVIDHRSVAALSASRHVVYSAGPDTSAGLLLGLVLGLAWSRRDWRPLLVGGGGALVAAVSALVIREVTSRGLTYKADPRFGLHSKGTYPSGHVTMDVAAPLLALVVLRPELSRRAVHTALWLIAGWWIVLSVALGIKDDHWVTDEIAGLLHALLVVALVTACDAAWRAHRDHSDVPPPRERPHRRVDPGVAPARQAPTTVVTPTRVGEEAP